MREYRRLLHFTRNFSRKRFDQVLSTSHYLSAHISRVSKLILHRSKSKDALQPRHTPKFQPNSKLVSRNKFFRCFKNFQIFHYLRKMIFYKVFLYLVIEETFNRLLYLCYEKYRSNCLEIFRFVIIL